MRFLVSQSGGFNPDSYGIGPGDLRGTYFQDPPLPAPPATTPPAQQPPATTPPAGTPPATTPPANTPPATTPPANDNTDWKAKFEASEAERKRLADEDKKRKDSELSELEREKNRATEAEKRAADAEAKALRLSIAAELGVPADALPLLTATDEAGMRSQAASIVKLAGAAAPAQQPPAGGTITQPGRNQQPSVDEQIAAAVKAGNTQEAIRLKRAAAFGGN